MLGPKGDIDKLVKLKKLEKMKEINGWYEENKGNFERYRD
jgi:hypothetical protein